MEGTGAGDSETARPTPSGEASASAPPADERVLPPAPPAPPSGPPEGIGWGNAAVTVLAYAIDACWAETTYDQAFALLSAPTTAAKACSEAEYRSCSPTIKVADAAVDCPRIFPRFAEDKADTPATCLECLADVTLGDLR